jgi:hypothetical protein
MSQDNVISSTLKSKLVAECRPTFSVLATLHVKTLLQEKRNKILYAVPSMAIYLTDPTACHNITVIQDCGLGLYSHSFRVWLHIKIYLIISWHTKLSAETLRVCKHMCKCKVFMYIKSI